jgi:hypothetical protein
MERDVVDIQGIKNYIFNYYLRLRILIIYKIKKIEYIQELVAIWIGLRIKKDFNFILSE